MGPSDPVVSCRGRTMGDFPHWFVRAFRRKEGERAENTQPIISIGSYITNPANAMKRGRDFWDFLRETPRIPVFRPVCDSYVIATWRPTMERSAQN